MQTKIDKTFDDLVEQFLGARLPQRMAEALSLSALPPYAQDFTMHMFALMKRAGYSATGFSPHLMRWLSATVPSILPNAWGGQIPPITLPQRHKKLDEYVAKQEWAPGNGPHIFVDLGCGFPPAKVVRCMNVLIYFEPEIKNRMLRQAGELLDDDGILIAGTNGLGIQCRYAVYCKGANGMFPKEFAFGLDNLGPIVFMPFFTLHENDPEANLLADLAGAIRADRSFWPDFSNRTDELLQHQGIFHPYYLRR